MLICNFAHFYFHNNIKYCCLKNLLLKSKIFLKKEWQNYKKKIWHMLKTILNIVWYWTWGTCFGQMLKFDISMLYSILIRDALNVKLYFLVSNAILISKSHFFLLFIFKKWNNFVITYGKVMIKHWKFLFLFFFGWGRSYSRVIYYTLKGCNF